MKKNDKGMQELLELLNIHPELISALVFDPKRVKALLKSKTARRLIIGTDTRMFLEAVSRRKDGPPIALCDKGTFLLCVLKSKLNLCFGGTRH